jgi:hypothetical protein
MPRERPNPPGLFKHPYFTRILKVKNPATVIFMAGHTPADENYQPVHPGDLRGQYNAILDALTFQLKQPGQPGMMSSLGGCMRSMFQHLWRSCAIRVFLCRGILIGRPRALSSV